ncbi:uncharacterized [Tachysurus ichikawai]
MTRPAPAPLITWLHRIVINKQQTLAIELLSQALVPASGLLYGFMAENPGETEQTSAQFRAVEISVGNNTKEG